MRAAVLLPLLVAAGCGGESRCDSLSHLEVVYRVHLPAGIGGIGATLTICDESTCFTIDDRGGVCASDPTDYQCSKSPGVVQITARKTTRKNDEVIRVFLSGAGSADFEAKCDVWYEGVGDRCDAQLILATIDVYRTGSCGSPKP